MPRPPASPSPPPASFPYTTGTFDFPHASSALHDAPGAPGQTARRLTRSARRGSLHRIFGPPRDNDDLDHLSRRPPTANPNRPRATPSERYLRRSQARARDQRPAAMEPAADHVDLLGDMPTNPPFGLWNARARPPSPTVQVGGERRNKRRKLDHVTARPTEYTCFKYGHKGQVVPGRLRMEIQSCDGGEHSKDSSPGLYKVQNVLRNDKSVYCSESSQCNLLLKHMGETPFALDKVVIRAPDRGFTAPVQEGLIFVSMSANELLAGAAAYNLQYTPRSPLVSSVLSSPGGLDEQLSLREAMEDPLVWEHSHQGPAEDMADRIEMLRLRSERLNAESANLISSLRSDAERRRILRQMVENETQDEGDLDNCDHAPEDSYSGAARVSAPTPPPFTVTANSEDEESDSNEELPNAAILADRLRRESRWRPDSDAEDDAITPPLGPLRRAPALDYSTYNEWRERRQRYLDPIRASRIDVPSRLEFSHSDHDTSGLIAPHARFFIAKNKNKITIKFHTAISGKHILLKFWSPKHDGNIDIESVQIYGYSGPRYFPATQPR